MKNRFINNVKIFFILFILLCNICTCSSYDETTGSFTIEGFISDEQSLPIDEVKLELVKISGSTTILEESLKNYYYVGNNEDGYYTITYLYNHKTEIRISGEEEIVEYVDYAEVRYLKEGYKDKIESFNIKYKDYSDTIKRDIILLKSE